MQYSKLKIGLSLLVILAGFVFVSPNMMSAEMRAHLPSWLKPMELGLDLQGGSYLLLEVDTSAVLREQIADIEESMRAALRDARVRTRSLRGGANDVTIVVNETADVQKVREVAALAAPGLTVTAEGDVVTITVPEQVRRDRQLAAVAQSLEIIRRRVDEFGTSEPNIQRQGSERIIVELPGVDNPERIKALIGQTAKLNFHLVEPNAVATSPTDIPPGTMLVPGGEGDPTTYLVRRRVEVSGERLVDAQPSFQNGMPVVSFRFDTAGGRRFGQVTSNNVGQRLAIVLDNKVISAPVIRSPIVGGSGVIEGGFTVEGAQDLALLLRAGALPAPLVILEERSVGPSLGADSIEDGTNASIVGGILVGGFMILSYFTFGVLAVTAMCINVILLLALLSVLGATLTLPGIAGIVLTLGMSVDSNVLIYERMREEWAAGRSLMNALTSGFNAAFGTIIDSNLTQLISGVLMFFLGSGPIRGFAVTLSLGIFTSLFATTMVTWLLVIAWYRTGKRTTLPI